MAANDPLIGDSAPTSAKMRLLQVLRQRLVFVHWNPETLLLLGRLLNDLLDLLIASPDSPTGLLRELVTQLAQILQTHQRQANLDAPHLRERVLYYLDEILQLGLPSLAFAAPLPRRLPVVLWLGEPPTPLAQAVELIGFSLQICPLPLDHLPNQETVDLAIIDGDRLLAHHPTVNAVRHRLGQRLPVVWLSQRGDLQARLDADQFGISTYLTQPVSPTTLATALLTLAPTPERPPVLLLSPDSSTAGVWSQSLEVQGFAVQLLSQGRRLLEAIHARPPVLVIIDDAVDDPPLLSLLRVLRSHPESDRYPCLVLAAPTLIPVLDSALAPLGAHLLAKPVAQPLLRATVQALYQQSQRQARRLQFFAEHDAVSGLLSVAAFEKQLAGCRDHWHHSPRAMFVLRLRNLHGADLADLLIGEALFARVIQRLRQLVGHHCPVGRLDFAHAAVLLPSASADHLIAQARQLYDALLEAPFVVDGVMIGVELAVGIVASVAAPPTVTAWLYQAQLALDLAMQQIPPIAVAPMDDPPTSRSLQVLRQAFEHQQLSLVFQAVVGLGPTETAERYEALLRVHNRSGRPLPPQTVFQTAQKHELGTRLDRWVVARALAVLQQRQQRRQPLPQVFVNLSAATLEEVAFMTWLQKGLEKLQIPAHRLIFEIPESFVYSHELALERFLLSMGTLEFGFSLDGFGLRDDSWQRLQELPVDFVKLAPAFTHQLAEQRPQQRRLRQLVEQVNHRVIVVLTNVEDAPTLYAAWGCGIRYAQGYYLQKPQRAMSWEMQNAFSLGLQTLS